MNKEDDIRDFLESMDNITLEYAMIRDSLGTKGKKALYKMHYYIQTMKIDLDTLLYEIKTYIDLIEKEKSNEP